MIATTSSTNPADNQVLVRDFSNTTMNVENNSNAGTTLGFNDEIYTSSDNSDSFAGDDILTNTLTPNLIVEIPELKTQSYNSVNSDKNNAIAFIPSEEITTNQQTGVLHYFTNYRQEQRIHVKNNTTINQLTVKVTDDAGAVLNDKMMHNTECVIKINDTAESISREQEDSLQKEMKQNYNYQNIPQFHNEYLSNA